MRAGRTGRAKTRRMMMSRRKRYAFVGAVALMVATVDVGVAQVAKRWFGWFEVRHTNSQATRRIRPAVYHHDLYKRIETVDRWGEREYPYITNGLGFRDASTREVPVWTDGRRILIIGDSFTEGLGLRFEDTFAGILHDRLGRRGIDVLNAAVASYSPSIYYRKTKYLLEEVRLKVDEVFVFLDISDIQDEADTYFIDDRDRVRSVKRANDLSNPTGSMRTRITRMLTTNSVALRFASVVKNRMVDWWEASPRADLGVDLDRALWTVDDSAFTRYGERGLRAARQRMDQLLSLLRPRGVTFRVVVYPWPEQIMRGDLHSRQVEGLAGMGRRE